MDATAQDAVFRNGDRSKMLSHSVRLLELESSSPIFTRSLASNRLSPSSAFLCSSIIHSSKYFSLPSVLPLEYPVTTLRSNSSSNFSSFLGTLPSSWLGSAVSPPNVFSRILDLAATPLTSYSRVAGLIEASSLPVASTKSLSVSSSTAALSWARVLDRGRPFRDFPERDGETLARWRRTGDHGLACRGTFVCGPWIWHHCGLEV